MIPAALRRIRYALVAIPTLAMTAGGWSVLTVDELPEHLVAGRAVDIAFVVRQHGTHPATGLSPVVEAVSGSERVQARAVSGKGDGQYVARLIVPTPGAWSLTLRSGFGRERVPVDPIHAVDANAPAPRPLPAAEFGRRLFAAKGCVTCHTSIEVGPKLNGKRYDVAWLAKFLENPQQVRPAPAGKPQMPTLGLDAKEIAALVAFVNSGAVASR
jgi:hypothetical protein